MEHTDPLQIVVKNDFGEMEMAIHPNDGQDLSLYVREHNMKFYAGSSIERFKSGEGHLGEGELHLLNECELGTLMVSSYLSSRFQFCDKAMLIRDEDRLFVTFRD